MAKTKAKVSAKKKVKETYKLEAKYKKELEPYRIDITIIDWQCSFWLEESGKNEPKFLGTVLMHSYSKTPPDVLPGHYIGKLNQPFECIGWRTMPDARTLEYTNYADYLAYA